MCRHFMLIIMFVTLGSLYYVCESTLIRSVIKRKRMLSTVSHKICIRMIDRYIDRYIDRLSWMGG